MTRLMVMLLSWTMVLAVRCRIYNRVSTDEQARDGYNLEEGVEQCRAYAEAKGWEVAGVYADKGVSGVVPMGERPKGREMLSDHQPGDVILAPALDRIGRHAGGLLDLFERYTVATLREQLDGTSPTGRFTQGIMAQAAQLERELTIDRVKTAGHARARQGHHHGGPPPYGYQYQRDAQGRTIKGEPWVPVPEEAAVVQRIFRQYVEGRSQHAIIRELRNDGIPARKGDWHQGTASAILRNPACIGRVRFGGEWFEGHHEPIIDPALWQAAADRRKRLTRTKARGGGRPPSAKFLFTNGALRCECGAAMVPRTDPNRAGDPRESYYCYARKQDKARCDQPPIPRHVADGAVYRYFERVGLDVERTRAELAAAAGAKLVEVRAYRESAERDERQAGERFERVKRDYQDGKLDAEDWREQREQLTSELDAARAQVDRMRERQAEVEAGADLADVEAETLAALARIRASIAGTVTDAVGVEAARAAILSLFDGFTLRRIESLERAAPAYFEPDLLLPGLYIEPHARPQAIERAAPEGYEGVIFPTLRRVPVGTTTDADGLPT